MTVAGACTSAEEPPGDAVLESAKRQPDIDAVFGQAPPATRSFPSVVILEPEGDERGGTGGPAKPAWPTPPSVLQSAPAPRAAAAPVPARQAVMDQVGGAFVPEVLLARLGQPVEFRNSDDVLHNVNVADLNSAMSVANVATLPGVPYEYAFAEQGIYAVHCDVHPAMEAYIVITTSLYGTVADRDGNFSLSAVPSGTYRLRVWNIDESKRSERIVEIESPQTELNLQVKR